jgi:hypothetical protein
VNGLSGPWPFASDDRRKNIKAQQQRAKNGNRDHEPVYPARQPVEAQSLFYAEHADRKENEKADQYRNEAREGFGTPRYNCGQNDDCSDHQK